MFSKIMEKFTGLDDLERVAVKGNARLLNEFLKNRRVYVPQKPRRFLDASNFSEQELLKLIESDCDDLSGDTIELWVLEIDGKKRLPAFSSQNKIEAFTQRMCQELNKVFAVGCVEALVGDVILQAKVDYIDINLFSPKSWEIEVNSMYFPP